MPNVKLFLDRKAGAEAAVAALMPALRDLICARLLVGPEAAQLALIASTGLPDQPPINLEIQILPQERRTAEVLRTLALDLQERLRQGTGLHAAIRISTLDPSSYIALK